MLKLAIVGRPNVGKSTLFNKIIGKQLAIVDDTPGVTRDWRAAEGHFFGEPLIVIDTAGLEEAFDDSIEARMRRQTEAALAQADLVLFVIDGRDGVTPMDDHFAGFLRKQKKPILLAVNKCENEKTAQAGIAEAYALGLGEPISISAAHSVGFDELFDAIKPFLEAQAQEEEPEEADDQNYDDLDAIEGDENYVFQQAEDDVEKPIKIAIVGRPNVGKSTLLNTILKEQRVMTGPEAGITRDAVSVDWIYNERKFKLVDTAGLRRKTKIDNPIEKMSAADSLRAIRLGHIVVLVLDVHQFLEKQDLQIAEHIINEGRALVIAVNKWDSVENKTEVLEEIRYKLSTSLGQIRDIPFTTISALNGRNIERLLEEALKTYTMWNKRVSTGNLNRWLGAIESQNPAPLANGRQNRLKYITQIKTRPPTFALWVSRPDELPDSYQRYVINSLRRDFDVPSVPIRLVLRASKNPFVDKSN